VSGIVLDLPSETDRTSPVVPLDTVSSRAMARRLIAICSCAAPLSLHASHGVPQASFPLQTADHHASSACRDTISPACRERMRSPDTHHQTGRLPVGADRHGSIESDYLSAGLWRT